MGSQSDLDQGGTFRQNQSTYFGPSVGWVTTPVAAILTVTAAGTTVILPGTSIVKVSVNGAVTIQLPLAKGNAAGAGAVPGSYAANSIIILDTGGFATNHPITVLPAGAEMIDGFSAAAGGVQLSSNYGALILLPDVINGGWTLTQ
jgi:hypothetical protein